jgi:folate-binding protein YgfZ
VTLADELRAVRQGAGVFALAGRSVLEVTGADRVRWLDGMISQDVRTLAAGASAPALLLTRQGRIVAAFQALAAADRFWLDGEAVSLAAARAQLERMIIADDVTLAERAALRLSLDGARAEAVLAEALGEPVALAPDAWRDARLAGAAVRIAAYGFTGLPAYQLFAANESGPELEDALVAAGAVRAGAASFECLRIEAGTPWPGRELDESVLPAEARMDAAVSTTKGCYTGQEVVARMRSRGRLSHLLVGLRFASDAPPAAGAKLEAGGSPAGQVTSATRSPEHGAIGLGFVRAELAAPGAALRCGDLDASVVSLPFAR